VATLAELASQRTSLDEYAIDHLLRLSASWSLLSDLSFSDLLLMSKAHAEERDEESIVVLGQMRPNNRTTLINDDLVGTTHPMANWPLVREAFERGTRTVGDFHIDKVDDVVPGWCVPVHLHGEVVAVMVRLQGPLRGSASLYEQQYLSVFVRLCEMVSDATFPYREDAVAGPGLPRVGDGIILLNGEGVVEFTTPNAANALHRLGIYASAEGRTLRELGLRARVVERSLEFALPTLEEIDRGHDVAILFHCVPLIESQRVTGVLARVRDVSDLRQLDRTRQVQRRGRQQGRQRTVSLVGYTNAGKSTLLNRLCEADVLVENRLFSTLDPRTRKFDLPGGETVLLTDTVGFVRKLPHQVVEAFRSTLEVVLESDLIVHVVDGSAPDLEGQIDAVHTVLTEIGADTMPELLVVNKADALGTGDDATGEEARRLLAAHPGSVLISARTGQGMDELLVTIGDRLRVGDRVVELEIPWARGDVLAAVHREGEIVGEEAGDTATRVHVVLDEAGKARFAEFLAS